LLYGNYIGVQYIFDQRLDVGLLQYALDQLISELPYLSSRYDRAGQRVVFTPEGVSVLFRNFHPGITEGHAEVGTLYRKRSDFIVEPSRKKVQSGEAPLMTATLTPFRDGGCVLGLAISHVLVDAAGFHMVARRLAEIYTARRAGIDAQETALANSLDVFEFGTERSKSHTLASLQSAEIVTPIKLNGAIGWVVRQMIIRAMDNMASNGRIVIAMNAINVARLKETVLRESGEDWISTNIALSAHFTRIIAKLIYGNVPKTKVQIGQLFDLRTRYFEKSTEEQAFFTGNAILIHTQYAEFSDGLQNASRGALARFFKQNQTRISAPFLQRRMDLIADCLNHGYSYPGLELKNPMIALNNQSKMKVYDLKFGDIEPLRVIPQDVGDNIMFFPTRDGGVEVYIRDILNPNRQEKLLTRPWQDLIFDF